MVKVGLSGGKARDTEVVVGTGFRGASDPHGGGDIIRAYIADVFDALKKIEYELARASKSDHEGIPLAKWPMFM